MTDILASALDGTRVLDLTEDRGLYAGRMLADLGADVIKIEHPAGSKARKTGPFKNDLPGLENSLYFINFNTNKRGITLNIETPRGREIFKKLIVQADIAINDFEPGKMKSLGLDYPALKDINPRLIMVSVSGFGESGPYSQYKAPDIVSFAMGGLLYRSGSPAEPPVVAPCEQAFHGVSAISVFGILAALFQRMNTGEGQFIEVSAHEAIAAFTQELPGYSIASDIQERTGSKFGSAPSRIYPCKDGFVHIIVIYPHHWKSIVDMIGNPEVLTDDAWYDQVFRSRNSDVIDPFFQGFMMNHTKEEITRLCQSRGIPCTPVNTPADFCQDAHEKARGFITEIEHPAIGKHAFLNHPYSMSETPSRVKRPAPLLGQHSNEIFRELGYQDKDLARLKAEGII